MPGQIRGVLFDLLMAVMDSPSVWAAAAGERSLGLAWRDAVTARMRAQSRYVAYEALVRAEAERLGLHATAAASLEDHWARMEPWPDASAAAELELPYGFVTNCSARLAHTAAARSGLRPFFVLSAEEIGWYKPHAEAYLAGCRRLGLAPTETLFVAGARYDADGAQAAGLQACLVRRRSDEPAPDAAMRSASSLAEVVTALAGAPATSPGVVFRHPSAVGSEEVRR